MLQKKAETYKKRLKMQLINLEKKRNNVQNLKPIKIYDLLRKNLIMEASLKSRMLLLNK
jgi:hypothetical protein